MTLSSPARAILAVIEAARVVAGSHSAIDASDINELASALYKLDALHCPQWRMTTWADVVNLGSGTRVRLHGVEDIVDYAHIEDWHADPRSPRWPKPLPHRVVLVHLQGRGTSYRMRPDGPVEVLDGPQVHWDMTAALLDAEDALHSRAIGALESLGVEVVGDTSCDQD